MLTTSRREVLRDDNRELFTPRYRSEQDKNFLLNSDDFSNAAIDDRESFANLQIAKKLFGSADVSEFEIESMTKEEDFINPNLMPSKETMDSVNRISAPTQALKEDKVIMNARAKMLIAGFAAVALALVLIIALTAVSVVGMFGDVDALQTAILEKTAQIEALENGLANGAGQENLLNKAEELGFQSPSQSQVNYYETLPTRAEQTYTVPSNWFDKVCEFFSGIVGG